MDARSLKRLVAELTGPIGKGERHYDQITAFDLANVRAHIFDDADRLVSHDTATISAFHIFVRPQIAAANACASDSDDRVGWLDNFGVRHVLDAHIPSLKHYSCTHNRFPLLVC